MNTENKKFIDLENLLRNKNPRLLKILPRFILNFIRKIIHEDDVNDFIERHGYKQSFEFAAAILSDFGVNVKVKGAENIPASGGYIFAANHPIGGMEAMALIDTIGKRRTDVKFLVNDILLQLKNFSSIFIPVNTLGKNAVENLELIDKTYASDQAVLVFPAGLVSRKQQGVIKDLEWKKSFITRAKKHQKNIIPVYIEGKNSDFFYNLATWRKRFGIKANLEMFFLPDEMYKQKNKTITLIFGKPVPYTVFDRTLNDKEWAEKMREQVYAIGEGKQELPLKTID